MTDILSDLSWHGLVADTTDPDALRGALGAGPIVFYCGFDPTAPSLHFGNLVQLVVMRRLQLAGHRPIAVVGGATGLIGDPGGRSTERVLNAPEVVAEWVGRIRAQMERFISFEGQNAALIANNLDWTAPMSAIDFLRDVGKHFSVNRMLAKESVSARLEAGGISYTEFSYQILQAMDYLELHRRYGCVLQTGGSDQWGNLTAGVDLIRRVAGQSVHALTTPLLTKADGTKFGKTAEGTVWLDPALTSPYAFYQYFVNVDDGDVIRLLKVFSFRPRAQIEELALATAERPAAREAQRALAEELTSLVHGPDECARVIAAGRALFGQGSLSDLDGATLTAALAEAPHTAVPDGPWPTWGELLAASGLVASRSAGRRTVAEGGAYVNNERITDSEASPTDDDLLAGGWLVLRRGKRALAGVRRAAELNEA